MKKKRVYSSAQKERARVRASAHYYADRPRKIAYQTNYHLVRSYGITKEEYDDMVVERGGRCDLCHRVPDYKLHVDHDHKTGKVRGLLCSPCNGGLGKLGDTVESLQRAIDYLKGA